MYRVERRSGEIAASNLTVDVSGCSAVARAQEEQVKCCRATRLRKSAERNGFQRTAKPCKRVQLSAPAPLKPLHRPHGFMRYVAKAESYKAAIPACRANVKIWRFFSAVKWTRARPAARRCNLERAAMFSSCSDGCYAAAVLCCCGEHTSVCSTAKRRASLGQG
jgi:hypothetical protein